MSHDLSGFVITTGMCQCDGGWFCQVQRQHGAHVPGQIEFHTITVTP
jgi:hypothetical protein